MRPFHYAKPDSLAAAGLAADADGAAFLAGGQTLLRDMKRGLCHHSTLIDLRGLVGQAITLKAGSIRIEAGATHAGVATSALVLEHLPMLAGMAGHIADPLVRHRATLGGAFAANEAAGDYPAVALALDAIVETTERHLAAAAFLPGSGSTALLAGEIVIAVRFPLPAKSSYVKILNPAARYAMVGACAALGSDGILRLAITGASMSGAFRWAQAEAALANAFDTDSIDAATLSEIAWREDIFADHEYRAHLVRVMARRAVRGALDGVPMTVFSHGAPIPGGATRA